MSSLEIEKILPEDGVPLAKLDLVPLLQTDELPPHEGVVEGVLVSGDETPSPVNVETFGTWKINIQRKELLWHSTHFPAVAMTEWGEMLQPVVGITKPGGI